MGRSAKQEGTAKKEGGFGARREKQVMLIVAVHMWSGQAAKLYDIVGMKEVKTLCSLPLPTGLP